MELYKFYGRPALLPAKEEGEPFVGESGNTQRQLEALQVLEDRRYYFTCVKPEEDMLRSPGMVALIGFADPADYHVSPDEIL